MWVYATLGFAYVFSVAVIVILLIAPTISTHCQPSLGTFRNSLIQRTTVASLLVVNFTCNNTYQSAVAWRRLPDGVVETVILVSLCLHFETLIDLVGYGYTIGYGNMPYYVLLAWYLATAPQYILC